MKSLLAISTPIFICSFAHGQKPRARDLGIPFNRTTGQLNAKTDVKGVEVGHSTIVSGSKYCGKYCGK